MRNVFIKKNIKLGNWDKGNFCEVCYNWEYKFLFEGYKRKKLEN